MNCAKPRCRQIGSNMVDLEDLTPGVWLLRSPVLFVCDNHVEWATAQVMKQGKA